MDNAETIKKYVIELFAAAKKLGDLTGRPFPLDGHTLGSIGEVYAQIHYGIKLHKPGKKECDGTWMGRCVQIKATQTNSSTYVKGETELLLVLLINSDGTFKEIYNGDGKRPWHAPNRFGRERNTDRAGDKIIPLRQLRELNKTTRSEDKILQIRPSNG